MGTKSYDTGLTIGVRGMKKYQIRREYERLMFGNCIR